MTARGKEAAALPLKDLGLRPATLRALSENGATIVADLLDPDHTRDVVTSWPGIGASRVADLDNALGRAGLAYGRPAGDGAYNWCTRCELCPDCGNPRAESPRDVAVDLACRAGHIGHKVGPVCDGCNSYHRALFAAAA